MRIGYSMWGLLGNGITDTPDGSRSYRRPFIDGLIAAGHDIVFLQRNRDRLEAGDDLRGIYLWDAAFLPPLDALLLEWRWPLPGRNTTACGTPGHTCDLHRQTELVDHYTRTLGIPTLIWDLDRQLPEDDPLRKLPNVVVGEFALLGTPGARRLLCPVPDVLLDAADPKLLARTSRPIPLVYVGNQYDRDEHFAKYFSPAAKAITHQVAGKWTRTESWPHVDFVGRVRFCDVDGLHRKALATVLLLPERYWRVGHMTSRCWEALLAGCIPLAPIELRGGDAYLPRELHVIDGEHVIDRLAWLRGIAGTAQHADLLAACLDKLEPARCSTQVATAVQILEDLS